MLGWTEDEARRRLARDGLFPVRPAKPADLALIHTVRPGWTGTRLPFGELFESIAVSAWKSVPDVVGRVLDSKAGEAARLDLARTLSHEAAPALAARLRPGPALWLVPPGRSGPYNAFVSEMLGGGWSAFLAAHPVLERQLALRVADWRASLVELAVRWEADQSMLRETFRCAGGTIHDLEFDLGDSHRQSRKVLGVTAGRSLIYKPRSLRMDVAWHDLLEWLRRKRPSLELVAPRALDCGTHGWVERVEAGSPDSPEEYYRRAGELLAVAWACGASDLHEENIVATQNGPVVVDLETLFTPVVRPFHATDEDLRALEDEEMMSDSVLTTLLLPVWKIEEDGRARDVSGLTGIDRAEGGGSALSWIDLGLDSIREAPGPSGGPATCNVPRDTAGRLLPAQHHVGDLVAGYEAAARALRELKDELPLGAFRGAEVRFLARSSHVYGHVLRRLRLPEHLAHEAARAIEVEKLVRAYLPPDLAAPRPAVMNVYEAERAALDSGDIPCFTAAIEGGPLRGDGEKTVEGYFWRSGWEAVRRRLRRADASFFEREAALVRSSVQMRNQAPPPRSDDPVEIALSIGEDLAERTVPLPCGGIGWLAPIFDPVRRVQVSGVLGMDLYGGGLGIAIFLAALSRVTGERRWAEMARQASLPRIEKLLESGCTPRLRSLPCGIGSGTGSFVYGCLLLGRLLGEEDFFRPARKFARAIHCDEDRIGDVLAGSAGGILALLALGGDEAVERAAVLGRHLLSLRVETKTGFRAWMPDFANAPLAGLGHGAAGCAWALRRLGRVAGGHQFTEAADEALAYEDAIFDPAARNWPDHRRGSTAGGFMHGWCAGPAGAAIARLAQFGGETKSMASVIDAALHDARHGPRLSAQHLCCGQAARVECVLHLAQTRKDAVLRTEAAGLAAAIARSRLEAGRFELHGSDRGRLFSPSFFQGTSGIGYTLLRVASADLPCVAAFELTPM